MESDVYNLIILFLPNYIHTQHPQAHRHSMKIKKNRRNCKENEMKTDRL
jgi:hypothetical protein